MKVIKGGQEFIEAVRDVVLRKDVAVEVRDELRNHLPLWIVPVQSEQNGQSHHFVTVWTDIQLAQRCLLKTSDDSQSICTVRYYKLSVLGKERQVSVKKRPLLSSFNIRWKICCYGYTRLVLCPGT